MTYKHIAISREDDVLRLTLTQPPLNILTIAMMKEIRHALKEARSLTDVKILLVGAEGKAFSAGADVGEHTAPLVEEMMGTFGAMFRDLSDLPFVTLAVVRGAALGGGCELAIWCDMIVASEKAKFGQPEINVGVFPPVAATIFPRLMGRNRAIEWILSGDVISARDAEAIGLVNHVYAEERFDEELASFVTRFTKQSAAVLAHAKRAVDAGLHTSCDDHLRRAEEIYMKELMNTHDAAEGLNAFLEKRAPLWRNR